MVKKYEYIGEIEVPMVDRYLGITKLKKNTKLKIWEK